MSTQAGQLREAISKFAKAAGGSTQQKPINVIKTWQSVLALQDEKGDGTDAVIELLSVLNLSARRLLEQIEASKVLDTTAKADASRVVSELRQCISLERLTRPAHEFKDQLSADKLAVLGATGAALRLEFEDGVPEQDTLVELEAELRAIIDQISTADLNPDLKLLLRRHASFMLWAIQNVDIFGGEGLREALGKLMVVGQRLPAEAEKNGKDLRTRLTKFLGATYTAVEKADKASSVAERLARLAEVGVKLLDKIN